MSTPAALMYSNLPDRAHSPQPDARTPVASLLGLLLRLVNAAYAVLALGLLGAAVCFDWRYHHGGSGASVAAGLAEQAQQQQQQGQQLLHLQPLVVHVAKAAAAGVASFPWFLYAMGGLGAYLLGMASIGASGVKQGSRWKLAVYIALLSLLILAEAAALLLLFTDNQWRQRLPGDPSGYWEAAQEYMQQHTALVKVVCLAVMGSQLVALGAASWLHSLQQAAYERWLDDREEAEARAREVLEQAAERQYAGGAGSLWTQRLRQKYGVTDSQVQFESAAVRQVAALSGDDLP
ncbi:hypothetical protein N2152v2_004201 [Parachlorella kessleri]